jgi:transposase
MLTDPLISNRKPMEFTFYLGVDVSKHELDFSLRCGKESLFHKEILNTPTAIKQFFKELKSVSGFKLDQTLICMEHTGIYSNHLLSYLVKAKASIWLESAIKIKRSMGLIRGKSDKIDATRIAQYAWEKREHATLWKPKREVVQKLAYLTTLRRGLVEAQKQFKTQLSESKAFMDKTIISEGQRLCERTMKSIKADLSKVEKAIAQIIKEDKRLSEIFEIVTSVPGVGPVTATEMILTTGEFEDFKEPKKFACYAGVAPFPHESGLFRGKSRVSHMANKQMKTYLHLAALVALQTDKELMEYYQRRVIEDKKSKMLVINAIRNKLIKRVFSCINQNRKYEKSYKYSVA